MKKQIIIWILLLGFCSTTVWAQGTEPYFEEWKELFRNAEYDRLLTSVEENLAADEPHPYAINAWVAAHKAKGDLKQALQGGTEPWKQQLRDFVAIDILADKQQDWKLYQTYGGERLDDLEEQAWALFLINTSELETHKVRDRLLADLKSPGRTFRSVWAISNLMDSNEWVRRSLALQNDDGAVDRSQLWGRFINRQATLHQQQELDFIDLIRDEADLLESDAFANRYLAHQLKEYERYEAAAEHYRRSFELNPFYGLNLVSISEVQARQGQFEDAEATAKQAAELYHPADVDLYFYRFWSDVLYIAGHYGKTESALEEGLKSYPDDAVLNYRMGRLELSNGRPEFAVSYFKKAAFADPQNLEVQRYYLQAMADANMIDEFLATYETLMGANEALTPAIYDEVADMYVKYEEPGMALETLEQGLEYFSESGWLYRSYAEVLQDEGDYEEAIKAMRASYEVDEIYEWGVWKLMDIMKDAGISQEEREAELRDLALTYPWADGVWKEWADQNSDRSDKAEIWKMAIEQDSFALAPYERQLRDVFWPERRWSEALDNLNQLGETLDEPYASEHDRVKLNFERGIVYIGKLRAEGLTLEEYEAALSHFKTYLEEGGYSGAYYQYVYELHKSKGNADAAAEALRGWIAYRPNIHENRRQTVTQIASEFPDRFLIYNELLERRPYNWENWKSMIQYNSVYGGSAINAIRLGREFDQRFPDRKDEIEQFIGISYGKLGSNIKHFEDTYGNRGSIGGSERYIDWFTSAKQKAWNGSTQLTFDWETNTATLLFEDGTVARQTDDMFSSRTTRVQVGDAFMEARYNDEILLTDIIRSDGKNINLKYNENGRISHMRSPDTDDISFAYNAEEKPIQMIMASDPPDTIRVYYDAGGSIDSVRSSAGGQATLKLSTAFQQLLSYSRAFGEATSAIAAGNLPSLGIADAEYEKVRDMAGYDAGIEEKLTFVKYLVAHTNVDPDYGSEALRTIEEVFYNYRQSDKQQIQSHLIEFIELNYELMMKIRSMGLPQSVWTTWADMTDWLTVQRASGSSQDAAALLAEINANPLELLPSSQWLPKSDLYNASYWKTFPLGELVKEPLRDGLNVNAVLIRTNGDVLLGTNKGLMVYRKGYWQHLAYNFIRRSFQNNVEPEKINASSDILSIEEASDGKLYLGSADGLFIMDAYKGPVEKRMTAADGLPSSSITHLEAFGERMLAATPSGAVWLSGDLSAMEPAFDAEEILFTDQTYSGSHLVVGTNKAVYLSDDAGAMDAIYDAPRRDGAFSENGAKLYTMKGNQVWVENLTGGNLLKEHALNGELVTTEAGQVYGLTLLPVTPWERALAVQTDLGLSIYHERHFEHFYLDRESAARPRQAAQKGDYFVTVTDDDVRIFRRDANDTANIAVRNLLSFNDLGFTVVADGYNPKLVGHNDSDNTVRELAPNDYMSTSVLAKADEHTLLLNNGQSIMRMKFHPDSAGYTTEELFYAASEMPDSRDLTDDPSIKRIVSDGDDVWVATGNAVFRYREQAPGVGELQEFNYFTDADRFPCYSDMVYNIFKSNAGDIYAVCSLENHRTYQGVAFKGGLLKFEPSSDDMGRFVRIDTDDVRYNWFVHSYTQIDDQKAILGTASGFGMDENGRWEGLKYWKENASYEAIYEQNPSLFLGTEGAALGDLWLFGSASGVVAYYDDNWFYPSRINAQLPEDSEYGRYGGRHINAIATSSGGKVYVGTDLGLLTYDSGSADPTKFIMDNYSVERSVEFFNTQIVQQEQDRIFDLKDIPDNSEAAELIASLKETKEQLARVKSEKAKLDNPVELLAAATQGGRTSAARNDSLTAELQLLNRKQNDLLLTLQQREPILYQTVQIDPLDLRSSRLNMNPEDVVVQYLPMSRKLFIQVLSKDKFQLREVEITEAALMDSVKLVAADLSQKAEGLRVGTLGGEENAPVKLSEERLMNLLSYLYEQLLRPIENDLAGYENVYIAPVGELNYLPFSALADRQSDRDITYAVERYDMGYVSSMYLFNLIYGSPSPAAQTALLMGDPDGSLTGARTEVQEIQSYVGGSQVFVGSDASTNAFQEHINSNNIIHLATHGYLNDESLKDSWILFSDKKFKLSEVYNLNLRNSSLVVLSACQTSLGGEGLEYATLSRAFLNAGTPSIIGTLWKVDDMPSKELMVSFYKYLSEGHNKFRALAMAKRELIGSRETRMNHPSKWASYIMIGKP